MVKLRSLRHVHFVLAILFVLTLPSDKVALHGNVAFLFLLLSTKKWYCNLLKKVFALQKMDLKLNL